MHKKIFAILMFVFLGCGSEIPDFPSIDFSPVFVIATPSPEEITPQLPTAIPTAVPTTIPTLSPTRTAAPSPPPLPTVREPKSFTPGVCVKHRNPKDGAKRGFLWKESETKVNRYGERVMIALLPPDLGKGQYVAAWKDNKELQKLSFVSFYTDGSGTRAIWRTEWSPRKTPLGITLQVDDTCFLLENSKQRID